MAKHDNFMQYHLNTVDDFELINWARREQSRYAAHLLQSAGRAAKAAVVRLVARLRYAAALNRLNGLNDRLLADVGLTRETVLDRMVEAQQAVRTAGNDDTAVEQRKVA